ncbi:hypothetical protein [Vibrio quintilis]|uniref:Uncharacterized protein n=1 Tax=Vibrio quintilis TaxID=1117707 RepID=A0A1M7YVR0_9VIBR|nr:hypothetical protein [Vibrio quintilis]SHO56767.1 hypothetical protein VQ7734_02536 [Vibrio quintilis]
MANIKTSNDYIDEIIMWCGVVTSLNTSIDDEISIEQAEDAKHRAIMALYMATIEYIDVVNL